MTIWEYNVLQGLKLGSQMNAANLSNNLNNQGKEGWELVTIIPGEGEEPFLIFKRPMLKKNVRR